MVFIVGVFSLPIPKIRGVGIGMDSQPPSKGCVIDKSFFEKQGRT
jgi:hypothetical protein